MDKRNEGYITVTGLEWERVFLTITLQSHIDEPVKGFRLKFMKHVVEIPSFSCDGNIYRFTINITAVDGRDFLDNGRWMILADVPGYEGTGCWDPDGLICTMGFDLAYRMDEYCRIFRYFGGVKSYNVSFGMSPIKAAVGEGAGPAETGELKFLMHVHFMIESDRGHIHEIYNLKHGSLKKRLVKRIKAAMYNLIDPFYRVMVRCYPHRGNRVLFFSETKPAITGNLEFIRNRMVERGLDQKYQITSCFREVVSRKMTFARHWAYSLRGAALIARQDIVFVEDSVPLLDLFDPDKRTTIVQTWHAGEGFKSVGFSRFGGSGTPQPVCSHKKYTYVITGSERLNKTYQEVFGLEPEAYLPLGMARLDGFLDKERVSGFREQFYQEHPECKDRRLILFAPTFRGIGQHAATYPYQWLDLKRIAEFCGEEYVWAFKMHPFVKEQPVIPEEYRDRIINLSGSRDINSLYYVTDILITDYSSAYYEYALLRKPVLFFTPDREFYELTRGVHKSVKDTAPGKVCDTFEEMMQALAEGDLEEEKIVKFADEQFAGYDDHASDRIIDRILLHKDTDQ